MRTLIIAAAIGGLLLVVLGASTGHDLDAQQQSRLNTILLFGFVHVLAAIGAAALPLRGALGKACGWAFLAGVLLFSGGLTARLVFGEQHAVANTLTMLVPVGGIAFMAGWILLIAAALMKRRNA